MTLPDLKPLADAGGWVVCVAVVIGVLTLLVMGKLVAGPTHDRTTALVEDLQKKLGDQTTLLREQGAVVARMAQSVEFMTGFVRDTLRDRSRGRDDDA